MENFVPSAYLELIEALEEIPERHVNCFHLFILEDKGGGLPDYQLVYEVIDSEFDCKRRRFKVKNSILI